MASETRGSVVSLRSPENTEINTYEVPSPEPGAVTTEVVRANICGSELHIWSGNHPLITDGSLGHEALCRVAELGEGVTSDYAGTPIAEGDYIAPAYFITCGRCAYCGRGEFGKCENAYREWSKNPTEHPHFTGTFATHYYVSPDQYFYRVPDGVGDKAAASANCALSQVLFGFEEVGLTRSDTVVVQGAGGLGLNALAVADQSGAETIAIDGIDQRLEMARRFGADHTISLTEYETVSERVDRIEALTNGLGADVAVEVTGVPEAFDEGIELLRKGGSYLEMGNIVPGETTAFDPGKMTRKSIDVTSTMRYDPWYLHEALEFLREHEGSYPFADLLDADFALSEVDEALEASRSRNVTRGSILPDRNPD